MGLGFRRWGDMKGKGSGGSGSRLNGNVGGEKKLGSVVESVGRSNAVQGRNDSGWGDNNDGNLKQQANRNGESSESKDLEQCEADHADGEKTAILDAAAAYGEDGEE